MKFVDKMEVLVASKQYPQNKHHPIKIGAGGCDYIVLVFTNKQRFIMYYKNNKLLEIRVGEAPTGKYKNYWKWKALFNTTKDLAEVC